MWCSYHLGRREENNVHFQYDEGYILLLLRHNETWKTAVSILTTSISFKHCAQQITSHKWQLFIHVLPQKTDINIIYLLSTGPITTRFHLVMCFNGKGRCRPVHNVKPSIKINGSENWNYCLSYTNGKLKWHYSKRRVINFQYIVLKISNQGQFRNVKQVPDSGLKSSKYLKI